MKKLLILCAIMMIGFSSCDNFLDPAPKDRYSEQIAWNNYENAKLYLNGFYKNLRAFSMLGSENFGGIHTDGLTDILKYGSNVSGEGNANLYAVEPTRITPDQNALGIWGTAYEKIRRINEFLQGLDEYGTFTEDQTNQLAAQARFVRAYIYNSLALRHGSVVLLDKPTTERDNARSSESEVWNFIEQDLDYAVENLPEEWSSSELSRITKGAALAMKSRSMLYAERWDKAIAAAESVIALEQEGVYGLADEYENAFNSRSSGNVESVLEFKYSRPDLVHTWDLDFAPGGDNPGFGGKATPTQNFVEEYETADGDEVDWSPWHNGTTQTPPYEDLEPRFHASVLYHGAEWKGREIEANVNGVDGFMDYGFDPYPRGRTTTGYFLKKYLDEQNTALSDDQSDQSILEIRYAEVLLNYAEACAMAGRGSDARNALNKIRQRVGLPNVSLSGEALLEKIRHERNIELAFEGHRYWDLRRWRLAHEILDDYRVTGMRIENNNSLTYEVIEADNQDRRFLERLYQFPIPSAEITNNTEITQIEPW